MNKRALIIRNAFSYDFGGAERYVVNLGCELRKNDWESIIVSRSNKVLEYAKENHIKTVRGWWWSKQNWYGKNIVLLPIYAAWQILVFFWYVYLIIKFRPTVIHPQSRDDFISATLAGRLFRKCVIWSDHADLKYVFKNIGVFYKNPIGKFIFLVSMHVSKIIVVSKRELSLINESTYPRSLNNAVLIYNGITDKKVTPKRDFDKTITVFALTSRLVKTKGIGEIIDASKLLDKNGINHRILLLGEGPEEAKFKKQAGKSVVFMGFPDTALSYVAGADIFVHPSYNEAFSLSLVEAAMLGKPTIATNVGGNPEIIRDKDTGILIKPMDVDSLYSALEEAIKNPVEYERYGKALRKSYEKDFQFDRLVKEQLVPLYNSKV